MQAPTADRVWDIFEGIASYADFCKSIAKPFILPPALPENLRQELLVLHKLLQHAYYEYRFIDIALLQALVLFEKVLRSFYEATEHKASDGRLYDLLNHFTQKGHFEFSNSKEVLHALRDMRNRKVHAKDAPSGLLMIQRVYRIINFINELYDDQLLRRQRIEDTKRLQAILSNLVSGGAALEIGKNRQLILYDATVFFVNNRKQPPKMAIAFWPEFDLAPYMDGVHHYTLSPLVKQIHSIKEISSTVVELSAADGEKLCLNGELTFPLRIMHDNWLAQALSLENVRLVMQVKRSSLNQVLEEALREYYTTPY